VLAVVNRVFHGEFPIFEQILVPTSRDQTSGRIPRKAIREVDCQRSGGRSRPRSRGGQARVIALVRITTCPGSKPGEMPQVISIGPVRSGMASKTRVCCPPLLPGKDGSIAVLHCAASVEIPPCPTALQHLDNCASRLARGGAIKSRAECFVRPVNWQRGPPVDPIRRAQYRNPVNVDLPRPSDCSPPFF